MQDLVRGLRNHAISSPRGQRRLDSDSTLGSGTESEDEELCLVNGTSSFPPPRPRPPSFSCTPPPLGDCEDSWDSVGRESGILTGDAASDPDMSGDVPENRRMTIEISPADCQFPFINGNGQISEHHDHPTNQRLQPRRCRVRVLVHHQAGSDVENEPDDEPPAKRILLQRPALDFDKMLSTRLDDTSATPPLKALKQQSQIL